MLEPGRNSTTFTATHPETGLETSQANRVYYAEAVELRADGLGAVSFGQDETATLAILTGLFGPPATETACGDLDTCVGMGYGWCRYIHDVDWPKQDLSILTADCEDPDGGWPEAPQFITWRVGADSTLRTPEGVGPGSTLGELEAVYGDQFVVGYDDCSGGLFYTIRGPDWEGSLRGHIPLPPGFELPDDYYEDADSHTFELDPATQVFGFESGVAQSC
jgi:hypothetical protein